jgi:hypothetical protein
MLDHVGLLANGLPPARLGRPLSSHPMIYYPITPTGQTKAAGENVVGLFNPPI